MHIYIREKETGRIITHFIMEDKVWKLVVKAARIAEQSEEDFMLEGIKNYLALSSNGKTPDSESVNLRSNRSGAAK